MVVSSIELIPIKCLVHKRCPVIQKLEVSCVQLLRICVFRVCCLECGESITKSLSASPGSQGNAEGLLPSGIWKQKPKLSPKVQQVSGLFLFLGGKIPYNH